MKFWCLTAVIFVATIALVVPGVIREESGAIIYVPEGYTGEPTPILYWLHWHRGDAYTCPPRLQNPNFIIVAPIFRREADWKNYDLPALIRRIELKYPASERWIEGYSRGADGAVCHAAREPNLFSRVTAIAGSYPEPPELIDNLTLIAGLRDDRWGHASARYGKAIGVDVKWIDSTHDPFEFYRVLDWKSLYEEHNDDDNA